MQSAKNLQNYRNWHFVCWWLVLEYFRNGHFGTGRGDFPVSEREFPVALTLMWRDLKLRCCHGVILSETQRRHSYLEHTTYYCWLLNRPNPVFSCLSRRIWPLIIMPASPACGLQQCSLCVKPTTAGGGLSSDVTSPRSSRFGERYVLCPDTNVLYRCKVCYADGIGSNFTDSVGTP